MKRFSTMIAAFAAALSFSAWAVPAVVPSAGVEVPVEYVETNKVTQVVVSDGQRTYVMNTEQKVEDTVWVTPEMANNALPFQVKESTYPKIFSISQAANSGTSDGTTTPFTKVGLMEPVTSAVTKVYMVYYKFNDQTYAFETTEPVGNTVLVTERLLASSSLQ